MSLRRHPGNRAMRNWCDARRSPRVQSSIGGRFGSDMAKRGAVPVKRLCAALLAIIILGDRHAGAQAPAVPDAAAVCLSCHGPFGRPETPEYPIIGGQNAAYLASALRAYRAGQRTGEAAGVMTGVAEPLDDRTIEDLAAFFSSLRSLR